MNNTVIAVLASVLASVVMVGMFFAPQDGRDGVGVAAGPEVGVRTYLRAGHTSGSEGCKYATTSTATSYTLTTAELGRAGNERCYLSWNPSNSVTLTTMASSSAPLSALREGETYSVYLYNASTTAAATITLAAGTGVDLQEDEGETVVVNGLEAARLTFLKKDDRDIIAWLEVGQVGD